MKMDHNCKSPDFKSIVTSVINVPADNAKSDITPSPQGHSIGTMQKRLAQDQKAPKMVYRRNITSRSRWRRLRRWF